MWTIRGDQLDHLDASHRARIFEERVQAIKQQMDDLQPEAAKLRAEPETMAGIRETVKAASAIGIEELEDQYEWSLRRTVLGRNFWESERLGPFLRDDLIHAKAKARYALLLSPSVAESTEKAG